MYSVYIGVRDLYITRNKLMKHWASKIVWVVWMCVYVCII